MAAADRKPQILKTLERIKKVYQTEGDVWRIRAYSRAITQIKSFSEPITSLEQLKGVPGIGKGILEKVQEVFEKGNVEGFDLNEEVKALEALMAVHGIGPVKAKSLYDQGIKTVDDLEAHPELLNEKQLIALKYTKDFELRIPRKEMEKHDAFIKQVISEIDPTLSVDIVGSYRRGLKDSGDIDILVTHPSNEDITPIINKLKEHKYLIDDFAVGPKKYLGVCKLKRHKHFRRIDILFIAIQSYPFAQLYFTGSKEFNIALRNYCLSLKLSLSEYGLKKGNQFITHNFKTEQDVFDYLGLNYIPPQERNQIMNVDDLPRKNSSP